MKVLVKFFGLLLLWLSQRKFAVVFYRKSKTSWTIVFKLKSNISYLKVSAIFSVYKSKKIIDSKKLTQTIHVVSIFQKHSILIAVNDSSSILAIAVFE